MGIPAGNTGSVNFIGGSNRKRTRAKIAVSTAEGMLIDEYISTKGSFSLARPHDVLSQKIIL